MKKGDQGQAGVGTLVHIVKKVVQGPDKKGLYTVQWVCYNGSANAHPVHKVGKWCVDCAQYVSV